MGGAAVVVVLLGVVVEGGAGDVRLLRTIRFFTTTRLLDGL